MQQALLDILACPLCKGHVIYDEKKQKLICRIDKLAFPIREGVPVMLIEEAEKIINEE